MNKDFSQDKLLSFTENKQLKILHDLASFIEENQIPIESNHFEKLKKYHNYLKDSPHENIQKLNKEFHKIQSMDYQFQVYLMNLERLLGQSKKEYEFLIKTKDNNNQNHKTFPIICLLDSVRSAHNVGAMFRNAECFGCQELILCGLTPSGDHQQVKKTAMGCDENVNWSYYKNAQKIITTLKKDGYTIWSIETGDQAKDLNQIKELPKKLIIIFGHEQFGVSLELLKLSDQTIKIPLYGQKNSLNVSVSQGIVLNQITQLEIAK